MNCFMKRFTRYLLILLITGCCLSWSNEVSATHAAGAELLYSWVRDSTYRITFKFYRDCSGAAGEPATVEVCYFSACTGFRSSVVLPKVGGTFNGQEVSPGCPGYPTRCAFGVLPGYREWIYEAEVTLPSRCSTWTFFTGINARNQAITNLQNAGAQTLYVEATLNNAVAQGNSSPYFSVKPVPYVCVNRPYTYNNGAVDINSDSLVFENVNPRTGPSTTCASTAIPPNSSNIPYVAPYTVNNPFATTGPFSVNTQTGQISFTPSTLQFAVITTKVREYRGGVEIGSVMRDIQVIVVACDIPQPEVGIDGSSLVNARLENDRIEGCSGTEFSFCVNLGSPDPGAVLVATDNHTSATPGATLTYTGQATSAIRACLTWQPGLLDTGLKILTFTVKDSTCRPPGVPIMQTFVIPVYVWPATGILKDTSLCPGDSVRLIAVGGSAFTWSVLPGGSPLSSMSCTDCKEPMVKPTKTTQYAVLSDNASICNRNRDTVTVAVVTPPVIDVGRDTTTCVNSELQLNLQLPPDPGTDYQIVWTPSTGLSDPTSPTPIATPMNDITYYVVVRPNGLDHCNARDTIFVRVLQGYDLHNSDTIICAGSTVQINTTGDARYTYRWDPTHGVSNPNIMSPEITPDSSGTYVLTASYPGCRDSVRSIDIEVQPVPEVDLGPDQILCYGDTFRLNPDINPSDYPLYTYTWNPGGGLSPGPNVPDPLFTASVTTTLTLTVSTPVGCSGTDDILLEVVAPDIISATSDTAICPGDTIQLHVWGTQVSQIWRPAYYISDTLSADPYVYPINSVTYTVYGRDKDNCLDTQVVHVLVHPRAVVELPDSARIYPGESYMMEPGGNCLYFEWFPPLGLSDHRIANPVATPEVNTRYSVIGRTETGCMAVDTMDLWVNLDSEIDMPNAFVPGGGLGGKLKPARRGNVVIRSFAIYNRWGIKMFETTDPDEGWDGQYNGAPQPMGVYVYVVEAETPIGRVFYKQGNVTLLR
jgi:hypothetical protein